MKLWPFPKRAPKAPASSVPAASPAVSAEALPEARSSLPLASPAPVPQEAAPVLADTAPAAAEAAPAPESAPLCPSKPEVPPQTAEEQPQPARVLSAGEAARFREFLRRRKETELALMLHRLISDLTSVSDRAALRAGVESAVRMGAFGVLVTPDKLPLVRKLLQESGKSGQPAAQTAAQPAAQASAQTVAGVPRLFALIGGTGETLPAVKKYEARKAVRLGAEALVLLPSVMLLHGGAVQAAKREWRPVLRAAGKRGVFVALTDPSLNGEETLSGVRAANKAGAAGVVVRGEVAIVSAAFREACPVCTQGVGSAEELSLLCKAGAGYAFTAQAECLAGELRQLTKESGG